MYLIKMLDFLEENIQIIGWQLNCDLIISLKRTFRFEFNPNLGGGWGSFTPPVGFPLITQKW